MLSLSVAGFAQQSTNRFEEEEAKNIENTTTNKPAENPHLDEPEPGPGNPGGPKVPIDDYIPALAIVGIGLMIYYTRRSKQVF